MHADGNGLYLQVGESGSKSWIVRTTIKRGNEKKRVEIGIGVLAVRRWTTHSVGIPVYTTVASPAQVVLLDAGSVVLADEGRLSIEVSSQAAIEMDTVPAIGELSPVSDISVLKPIWQNNLAGFKLLRWINWQARTGAAVYMSTSY